ncbi:MAG: ABC transporter permease [Coriobacteriales bacterium]|jgi:putative ABC transport system permease protein|nr:ABC transporter permease [Coriobacteriales bacterium]
MLRKMLRDMARHKTQFVSIFLMAFLAIFIYTGVGGEWRGLQKSVDDFYAETNLADAFLYGNGFSDGQVQAVKDTPGVSVVERRLELSAVGDLENKPILTLYFVENGEISKPFLAEGVAFDKNNTDGIWLDKRFANAQGLKPGDTVGFVANDTRLEKTVRGLIYSAEQVFESGSDTLTPNFADYGYAFLSAGAFPVPEMLTYTTLLIKADDRMDTGRWASSESGADLESRINSESRDDLESRLDAALNGTYNVYLERENLPSVSMFNNEIQQHKMMGDIFPVVFLLIALLTLVTTMTRIVTNQRIQIGTLKALGFKKWVIARHYVAYGFFLAALGAVLGLIIGPITLPYLFYPSMSGFYTLPEWKPAYDVSFVLMAIVLIVLCAAVNWLACANLLRETPADTLRPKAPKSFRHGLLERTSIWDKLGFNVQWNLRDSSKNRIRALMAIIGVFGCTALVVCALSMNDAMGDLKVWQYETINHYESKLALGEATTQEQIDDIVTQVDGETIMEGTVEIRAGSNKKSASLLVLDNTTLIRPTDVNLQPFDLPQDGVFITQKMATALDVKQSDEIEWHIYGVEGWTKGQIAAIYRDPVNQGITMNRAQFEAYGMEFYPTAILTAKNVTESKAGVDSITLTADSMAGWDDLTEAMYIMVYLLIAAAAVLSVVVLYNLGLLAFTEMEREMATLKVMGLKSGKLRGLLLTQNLWFSTLGFAFGVPGGIWLTNIIVSLSGDEFDFPIWLHPLTLLAAFVFTFGLSVLVNLLFSRKIRRLDMVESLKVME